MISAITRFCPCLSVGDLHVGHLINVYANLFYAKKHGGKFHIVADGPAGTEDGKRNIETLNMLLPNREVTIYTPEILKSRLIEDIGEDGFSNLPRYDANHFWQTVQDYYLNVDVLIRGDDWRDRPDMFAELSQDVLEKMYGRPIKQYWHALLFDNDAKISKSHGKKESALSFLLEQGVSRFALLSYIVGLFEGRRLEADELFSYHEVFDIERVCARTFPVYEYNDVIEIACRCPVGVDEDQSYGQIITL
jgi:hypothetical protein